MILTSRAALAVGIALLAFATLGSGVAASNVDAELARETGLRGHSRSLKRFSSPALTTRGNQIVDASGRLKVIRGLAWYGMNIPNYNNFWGNVGQGTDSVTKDIRTNLWRIKQLGFNAVRLGFSFDILNRKAETFPQNCAVASPQAVIQSVLHPGLKNNRKPWTNPPSIKGGVCNAGMPTSRPWEQFVWTVGIATRMGLYVSLDYHSNKYGDSSFYHPDYFISQWKALLRDINKQPGTYGRILLDPLNEPDGYDCDWESCQGWGTLTNFYDRMFTQLHGACPTCLLLAEGAGQANGWSNYGDGFTTDQFIIGKIRSIIKARGQKKYADATPFFRRIHFKPYQKQVVLAPHIYCPAVTQAIDHYAGNQLYERLQWSFGDKQAHGFTYRGVTRKYAVINGEFGSNYKDDKEKQCMASIFSYMRNQAAGFSHPPITSYFYWVWNADSLDTGGILQSDWRSISWGMIDELRRNAGLVPWYQYARRA